MSRTNAHGQKIGDLVDWSARPAPGPVTLTGKHVRIEPVSQAHRDGLYDVLCGPDDAALWTYRAEEQPASVEELGERIAQRETLPGQVTFTILTDAGPAGMASLTRIDAANGSVEIGGIILGRPLQQTRSATEAMVLFARHVFDDLGYRRYEWKCDSLNGPSRRAALRLGFVWEGRFRNALVYKGRNRDTDWFSITDVEWPGLARAFDSWLDDANFDVGGRQRQALSDLTARGDGRR
ncbi:GNAT family N-acetyltransferase [Nocardioides sp. LHG3406-4]|uniref:GNAT family N-acetyltransferase n=1 Tax=Nocardioides sp. LHG3406-4 TaxID=2804575 RepID=UPI003CEF4A9A